MLQNWLGGHWFNLVHGRNLVYNTCWEDPRLDRVALELTPDDSVMVITSAGCNALDYALERPKAIHAVDVNPRQNALLELKIAAIRKLDYETFFKLFGRGQVENCRGLYQEELREMLSPTAQAYWDKRIKFFKGKGWQRSFYFHGTSGTFARLINTYIDRIAKVREGVMQIVEADSLEKQQALYQELRPVFWTKFIRWVVGRDATLSMVGVPRAQREQVEKHYEGGIAGFVEDCVEAVFARIPFADNYFWRVYLTGEYTPTCCPEYLKPENFEKLKGGLVDSVHIHTNTILNFLRSHDGQISRYILLDHMDWLAAERKPELLEEWQAIVDRAAPKTRILWRSGGLQTEFVDPITVQRDGQEVKIGDVLEYHPELAAELHEKDRVHTYGSFYIADLLPA